MEPLDYLRFATADARSLTGVNRATWSRWRAGKSRVPVAVVNLLRILRGDLEHLGTEWQGWKFHNGELFDPSGIAHTPGSILAWHWSRQELQAARRDENHSATAGGNVVMFPGRRSAAMVTAELYRRLGD